MMNMSRLTLVAVAGALLLGACSKPYGTPSFDAGQAELPASNPAVQFDGFASQLTTQRSTKVFWTHGMCTQGWGWINNTENLIRASLRAAAVAPTNTPETGNSYTWTTPIRTPDGTLETTFYVWSPLTQGLKKTLNFDNATGWGAGFRYDRAPLNEVLKRSLLNDCLADAVVVSGPNRTEIYQQTRKSLCEFLGGRLAGTTECKFSGPETPAIPRVLVAESLGSKIIADAVLDLTAASGQEDEFSRRLSSIRQIFLLANQLPLLDLADASAAFAAGDSSTSALSRLVKRLEESNRTQTGDPIQVVAFTDPNDLLSYRLSEKYLDSDKTDLINVMVSNDWTYTVPFVETLSLERPDAAHCDYQRNNTVMALAAVGNPGRGQETWQDVEKRIQSTQKKGCGF
ncbi:MAG: hypothetical protein RIF37_01940 [Rhodospirillaceae bacterium]